MTEPKRDPSFDERRYKITALANFRLLSASQVEVVTGRETLLMPLEQLQLLLSFAEPTTIREVHELMVGDVAIEVVAEIVRNLASNALLEEAKSTVVAPDEEANLPLFNYLNEQYQSEQTISTIGALMRAGKCVVIEDAFQPGFAEAMHECLDAYEFWKPHDDYSQEGLSYHHHNIYDRYLFPSHMRRVERLFSNPATTRQVAELTNRDCGGPTAFGASLYLPGDHSLPHSDAHGIRNVTFIWHLAKNWQLNWGGGLYWCSALRRIHAKFNTLILFNVTESTVHFVESVRPTALGRRYCINGWWQSSTEAKARVPMRDRTSEDNASRPQHISGIEVF